MDMENIDADSAFASAVVPAGQLLVFTGYDTGVSGGNVTTRYKDSSGNFGNISGSGGTGGGNTLLLMHFNSDLTREGILADGGIVTEQINSMDAEMGGGASNWTPTFSTGKFGNAILFDGSNQSGDPEWEEWYNHKLTLPVSADILTDDFTIEFWYKTIVGYDNSGGILTATANNIIYFGARGGGNPQEVDTTIGNGTASSDYCARSAAPGVWHHTAFVRNGDDCVVYIDGQVFKTFDVTSLTSMTKNALLCLGTLGNRFYGLIDELRISKIARYTSTFTPPTAAFTVD